MRQHTALMHFEDGLPMSKIQYAQVTGQTPRIAAQAIRNMVQYGYIAVKDCAATEMKTPRYLGERFVITPAGIERLRMMDAPLPAPAREFNGETIVQRAKRIRSPLEKCWRAAA